MTNKIKEQAIATLKAAVLENTHLPSQHRDEMVAQLNWISFSLHTFQSKAEKSGFNAYVGDFDLSQCPYEQGSKERMDWEKGWSWACNNPYLLASANRHQYYAEG